MVWAALVRMPRWRVDSIRNVFATLGTVEAPDEKRAIAKAAEMFNITADAVGTRSPSRGLIASATTKGPARTSTHHANAFTSA